MCIRDSGGWPYVPVLLVPCHLAGECQARACIFDHRDEHDHDAEHHKTCELRHALEERVHVFDVTRADVVLCGAHAQEEQALRDSVEDNEEDRSPDRLCGTNARTSRDEAKVRDEMCIRDRLTPVGTIICYILILVAFIWAIIATIGFTALF